MSKTFITRIMMMLIGNLLAGFAVALFRISNFGTDPFATMNLGVSSFLNMSFGVYQLLINIVSSYLGSFGFMADPISV